MNTITSDSAEYVPAGSQLQPTRMTTRDGQKVGYDPRSGRYYQFNPSTFWRELRELEMRYAPTRELGIHWENGQGAGYDPLSGGYYQFSHSRGLWLLQEGSMNLVG